jgi:integrase
MELEQIIKRKAGNQSGALITHLKGCFGHIPEFREVSKTSLSEFSEYLLKRVSQSSASTYTATLKSVVNKWCDDENICNIFTKMHNIKVQKPVKIFLTEQELEQLRDVVVNNDNEQYVRSLFLIGAYTGARISDIWRMTKESIHGKMLSYVSKKTSTEVNVPCKPLIKEIIKWCYNHEEINLSLVAYNNIIRQLCERAGIKGVVRVFKAGKNLSGEKWQYVSSHTARISFATNLAIKGVPILDISRWMGHSGVKMTERYICQYDVKIIPAALEFFK